MEGEDAAGHQGHHEGETQTQSETRMNMLIHTKQISNITVTELKLKH